MTRFAARIQQRLIAIASAATQGDDEAAHSLEDQLFFDVLTEIAAGASDARVLARLAIRSRELKFARHCA